MPAHASHWISNGAIASGFASRAIPFNHIGSMNGGWMGGSPGGLGGLRGLVTVRSILSNIGVVVLPKQHALSKAHEAFEGDEIPDDRQRGAVEAIGAELANFLQRLES